MVVVFPYIPENITVHLGAPDSPAENVTLPFTDYIKNVASGEIYPTWSQAAITANILAQISYALNRVYTEYYPSRGYNFDITSTTALDQSFQPGRTVFTNISDTVDEVFDSYIRRMGFIEPLAAKYCNGTTTTCEGLSQWGSQALAEEGLSSIEILRRYYGDDIEIVNNAPVRSSGPSYPGTPIRKGDRGNAVNVIQTELNQISNNYTAIPKINPVDSYFGDETEEAVREFQRIFGLTVDGIVGKQTWYKLIQLYVALRRLAELKSEGQTLFGEALEYPGSLSLGDSGKPVEILQYLLALLSLFVPSVPAVMLTGTFDGATRQAVIAAQRASGLPQTGTVNNATWDAIYRQAFGINETVDSLNENTILTLPAPERILTTGSSGEDVRALQRYLNVVSSAYPGVLPVNESGMYGAATRQSVLSFQRRFGLPQTGDTDYATWSEVSARYRDVVSAVNAAAGQYVRPLVNGSSD